AAIPGQGLAGDAVRAVGQAGPRRPGTGHRAPRAGRLSVVRRGRPVAREMNSNHDGDQREDGEDGQPPRPPAGLAIPALAEDVTHGRTTRSTLISSHDDTWPPAGSASPSPAGSRPALTMDHG